VKRFLIFILIFFSGIKEIYPEAKVIYKMGTLAPEGSSWLETWYKIVKDIEESSNGKISIKTYPGGIMGDEPDMVRKLRLGQLQIGGFTVNGIYATAPEMLVLELPFLFEDYDEIDYVREKMFTKFKKIFEEKGYILLAWLDQGLIKIYTKRATSSFEDLKKQKMWVWAGEPVAIETFKVLGIPTISTPVPEVLSSLQTGLVDAIYTSPLACVALQWYTQINYILDVDMRYEPAVVIENKKAWDETPKEMRGLVEKANEKYIKDFIKQVRREQMVSIKGMLDYGVKIQKLKGEEIEMIKENSRLAWYNLAGKLYPKELLDEVIRYIDEYRKIKRGGTK